MCCGSFALALPRREELVAPLERLTDGHQALAGIGPAAHLRRGRCPVEELLVAAVAFAGSCDTQPPERPGKPQAGFI